MKAIKKKKIFKKAMFLFLACMLMLVPFTFGVAALSNNDTAIIIIDEEDEPIMVTMSSCNPCTPGTKKFYCNACEDDIFVHVSCTKHIKRTVCGIH